MHVNVNMRLPIARTTEADFVIPILVDVIAPGAFQEVVKRAQNGSRLRGNEAGAIRGDAGEELTPEFVVGRIWAERIDWALAETCGYAGAEICDAASAIWQQVFSTISNKRSSGFRRDLQLDMGVEDLIFIHESLLHPEIQDRVAVMDCVLNSMMGMGSLALMHYEQGMNHHLEDWEYRDLGFKKIARTNLLLRDNHYRYPFGDLHIGGRELEFVASSEHEEWLVQNWDSLLTDHPSL
jgi:hypothetical protein